MEENMGKKRIKLLVFFILAVSLSTISKSIIIAKSGEVLIAAGLFYAGIELLFRNSVELLAGSQVTSKDIKNLPLKTQRLYRITAVLSGIICILSGIACIYAVIYGK